MKIKINSMKLIFIYRTFLFRFCTFETDNKDMKSIVKALNIKNRKQRITYVFDETIIVINNYYSEDLCMFKDGKCIVQRENNSNSFNGCCMRCPIVTEKGCPSDNITCKLVYCKKALGNMKLLKFKDIKILKCFSISQRLIILSGAFSTREEVIKDLYYGLLYSVFRNFYKKIKSILAKVNLKKN